MILCLYQNNDQWFIVGFYWLQGGGERFISHYCQWYVLISFIIYVGIAWNFDLSYQLEVAQGYGSAQISYLYSTKDHFRSWNMGRFLILREIYCGLVLPSKTALHVLNGSHIILEVLSASSWNPVFTNCLWTWWLAIIIANSSSWLIVFIY